MKTQKKKAYQVLREMQANGDPIGAGRTGVPSKSARPFKPAPKETAGKPLTSKLSPNDDLAKIAKVQNAKHDAAEREKLNQRAQAALRKAEAKKAKEDAKAAKLAAKAAAKEAKEKARAEKKFAKKSGLKTIKWEFVNRGGVFTYDYAVSPEIADMVAAKVDLYIQRKGFECALEKRKGEENYVTFILTGKVDTRVKNWVGQYITGYIEALEVGN